MKPALMKPLGTHPYIHSTAVVDFAFGFLSWSLLRLLALHRYQTNYFYQDRLACYAIGSSFFYALIQYVCSSAPEREAMSMTGAQLAICVAAFAPRRRLFFVNRRTTQERVTSLASTLTKSPVLTDTTRNILQRAPAAQAALQRAGAHAAPLATALERKVEERPPRRAVLAAAVQQP